MWDQVNVVLTALNQTSRLSSAATQTGFEKFVRRVTNALRWFAVVISLILLILVLFKIMGTVTQFWGSVAIWLAFAQMCAALSWVVLDILPMIVSIVMLNRHLFVARQHESKHDFLQAEDLRRHDVRVLELTKAWLDIKIERMRLGLVLSVGGSDKVAFLILAASAWTVWRNFPKSEALWIQDIYLYGGAFFGGLAVGGILANMIIRKLMYQKDLLSLAIALAKG